MHWPTSRLTKAHQATIVNGVSNTYDGIQLGELTSCSYDPLAGVISEILPVEARQAELGTEGLIAVLAAGHDPIDVQASLNYWYPRVVDTFGRTHSEHLETYRRYGLREHEAGRAGHSRQSAARRASHHLDGACVAGAAEPAGDAARAARAGSRPRTDPSTTRPAPNARARPGGHGGFRDSSARGVDGAAAKWLFAVGLCI